MTCARSVYSYTSALGAARRIPRTAAGCPMSSTSPTKASTGQVMSVSVTSLPVDGETAGHHPVVRDELLEQLGDRRAGPGDPAFATPGICAAASRGSSASRSCS